MVVRSGNRGEGTGRRRAGWRSLVLGLALGHALAGALAVPGRAAEPIAADAPEDPRGRFALFLEAAPQVIVQRTTASVDANFGNTSNKANVLTNMVFRLGGGVKGPALIERWGAPRPVLYAAALVPLNESGTVGKLFKKTTPRGFEIVENTKFSLEYKTSATAGLGLEFKVPVLDTEIGIMPAIESLHIINRYVGRTSLSIVGINRPDLNEEHAANAKKNMTQHYLGPALRVSAPTAHFGPFAIDFFLHSSVLFDVAGTRRLFFANGANGDRAGYNFESGTGIVQITSGFQVRWP